MVESGGDNFAIGDNGRAYGCLQIHEICVKDVNRIYGTNYVHEDAFHREKAIKICELYLSHYASEKRLGRVPTAEDMARIWNGGPMGYKKSATENYWRKVKQKL